MDFLEVVEWVGQGVDAAGVAVMVLGIALATLSFVANRRQVTDPHQAYRHYRHAIGRAILLELEVLVAADIIRTVAVEPTFRSVGILALIVLIRTFLSATLELELEGRWPWQVRAESSQDV